MTRLLVQQAVLLAVVGAAWWWGVFPTAVAGAFAVLLVLVVALLVGLAVRIVRHPLAARLDAAGVTFERCPLVPWTDLAAVEVGPLRSSQPVGRPSRVVAFLPRPGVTLPVRSRRAPLRWVGASNLRRFGTSLVLPTFATDATAVDIVGAAARLGGLPVVERPVRRGVRLASRVVFAVLLGATLLVGLAMVVLVVWPS